jgi:N-acetylglutamate synthase-like GNAT family acetyltransferase
MSMRVVVDNERVTVRCGNAADAPALLALISAHTEEGRLLPRSLGELSVRAAQFVIVERAGRLVGCAELAPLSSQVAEVRSLVVDRHARGEGLALRMVEELARRARLDGFDRLCAFAHDAGFFVRLGFSIVPHTWVPEKIAHDCVACALFQSCGQQALVRSVRDQSRREASRETAAASARPHAY